jgi:uncharacterized membrane protein YqaE (UPF0057 family)
METVNMEEYVRIEELKVNERITLSNPFTKQFFSFFFPPVQGVAAFRGFLSSEVKLTIDLLLCIPLHILPLEVYTYAILGILSRCSLSTGGLRYN